MLIYEKQHLAHFTCYTPFCEMLGFIQCFNTEWGLIEKNVGPRIQNNTSSIR